MLGQDVEAALRVTASSPRWQAAPSWTSGTPRRATQRSASTTSWSTARRTRRSTTPSPRSPSLRRQRLGAASPGARVRQARCPAGARVDRLRVRRHRREPYAEDAPVAPRSAYGRTKLAGEWAVRASGADALVVRTAWLYGAGGRCFPRTIAGALRQRDGLDVVADQVGQPTWTADVARVVLDLVRAHAPAGTYHATSGGQGTWHDLAQAVARATGADPERVRPTTSEQFVRPAPRPAYSVLGHEALRAAGVEPIGPWQERFEVAASSVLGRPGGRAGTRRSPDLTSASRALAQLVVGEEALRATRPPRAQPIFRPCRAARSCARSHRRPRAASRTCRCRARRCRGGAPRPGACPARGRCG